MRSLLTAAQVADRLQITVRAFWARRRSLEAEHGFPAPVPGIGQRWDPAAIQAWQDRTGGLDRHDRGDDGAELRLIARAREISACA